MIEVTQNKMMMIMMTTKMVMMMMMTSKNDNDDDDELLSVRDLADSDGMLRRLFHSVLSAASITTHQVPY